MLRLFIHAKSCACFKLHASAVIIAHNHPSGCPEPSSADLQVTEQIIKALELMNIQFDHVVSGDGACVSFAERGWLKHGWD